MTTTAKRALMRTRSIQRFGLVDVKGRTRTAPLALPRSSTRHASGHRRGNVELWAWLFMRWSGVVLLILIFIHLFANLVLGDGIQQIDFAFVAGKWAHPFWQWFDFIMLWLAMLHGTNGLRVIINDYAEHGMTRLALKAVLLTCTAVIIALGSLVIFTFDPCPPGSPAGALPDWCSTAAPAAPGQK